LNSPPDDHPHLLSRFFDSWNRLFPSGGLLCLGALWVAIVSGIVLALPYDMTKPYDSLQVILIANPAGAFFRAIHYWSADLFLIFASWHLIEQLSRRGEQEVPKGIWLRLVLSIPFILYVMISGFILKGDREGTLARQVLGGLLGTVPVVAKTIRFITLGLPDNLSVIYLHHIATSTLVILIISIEHARRIWPEWRSFIYMLSLSVILSAFEIPSLHDGLNPVVKGPWYMLGLQEVLHWTSYPGWILAFGALVLLLLYGLPFMPVPWSQQIKRGMLLLLVLYLALIIVGWLFRGANWQWVTPWARP